MINELIKRTFLVITFLYFTNHLSAQSIFPNSDFESASSTCNCQCADFYTCDNDASWAEDGVDPLHHAPFGGDCFSASSPTMSAAQCARNSITNRLGAHSGVGYMYFYAGGDKVTSPDTTFTECKRLEICVWYCGPQDTAGSGQNLSNRCYFRFGVNGTQRGGRRAVPFGTLWTKYCYTINLTPGTYNFNILSGGAASYNIWFDDFTITDITDSLDPTITDPGPYCVSDNGYKNLSAIDEGTWTSNTPGFFISSTAGTFRPSNVGAGVHRIYNTLCNGEIDSLDIVIHAIPDATIAPAGTFCIGDSAVDLSAVVEGVWSGTGIINTSTGLFDPTLAGVGTHRIYNTVTIFGPCSDIDSIDIIVNTPAIFNQIFNSICDSLQINGNWYYSSQIVRDTIVGGSSSGCDSIINTTLNIINSSQSIINASLCNTNYTSPSGKTFTTSGVYYDTIPNTSGCDSLITINLTINPVPVTNLNPPAYCDSAQINGNWYFSSQTVRDTLVGSSSAGCDSIVVTNLMINHSSSSVLNPTRCNSSYTSPSGKTFTTSGVYYDTIPNTSGCDSLITINFTRNIIPVSNLNPPAYCDSAYVSGVWYYTSQIVRDTIYGGSSAGCDSIVNTNLIINTTSYTALNPPATCDSAIVNGNWYYTSQIVRDTLIGGTSGGCDSIVNTNLIVNHSSQSTLNPSLCNTNYTSPSGKIFTSTGTYLDTILNSTGCDSVMTINLIISSSVYTNINPSPYCDSAFISGNWYYSSQIVRDTIIGGSSSGCDSIINTTLNIINSSQSIINASLCNTNYTSPSGKTFTTSGVYYDTIPNISGCDSLITINLTINPVPVTNLNPPAYCDSAQINGNWYYVSQVVIDTLVGSSSAGCDSIVVTNLMINHSSSSVLNPTRCNSSYTSPSGKTFTTSGVYYDTIPNTSGCDSLITINLTINPIPVINLNPPAYCDSAQINGNWYYVSQIVRDTIYGGSSAGCDSIVNTNLIINTTSYTALNPPATCDSAIVNGNWYYTSQIIRDTLIGGTSGGCDSIVNTNLIINHSSQSTLNPSLCNTNYTSPSGKIFSSTGIYLDTILNSTGCDSVMTINLIISSSSITNLNPSVYCDSVLVNGNWYYTSQTVSDTFIGAASNGCDSIVNSPIIINYSNYDTINISLCNSNYVSPSGKVFTTSGIYYDTIPNTSGCDSLITINYTNNPVPITNQNPSPYCDSVQINGNWYFSSQTVRDTLVGSSSAGCDSIVVTNLIVLNTRQARILNARDLCSNNSPVVFNASPPGGSWSGGNIDTTGRIDPSTLSTGMYNIKYDIAGICTEDDSAFIEVYQAPDITYISNDDECKEGVGTIDISVNGGFSPISYLWNNGDTTQDLDSLRNGTYILRVIDFYGCIDFETITINSITTDNCFSNLFVPNSFTPNNDGKNDKFRIVAQHISEFNLKIFNRWGELIFESNDVNTSWDGFNNGELCKSDTYVWRVTYSNKFNKRFVKHGHIKLMR